MKPEPLAIPLKDAAFLLSIRDVRTVLKYAKEGRIRIVGSGNGQKVVVASIYEYLDGRSAWHAKSKNSSDGRPVLVPFDSSRAAKSRMKQSSSSQADPDVNISCEPKKLTRTSTN